MAEKTNANYDTIQRLHCRLKIKGVQTHFRGCISKAEGAELQIEICLIGNYLS